MSLCSTLAHYQSSCGWYHLLTAGPVFPTIHTVETLVYSWAFLLKWASFDISSFLTLLSSWLTSIKVNNPTSFTWLSLILSISKTDIYLEHVFGGDHSLESVLSTFLSFAPSNPSLKHRSKTKRELVNNNMDLCKSSGNIKFLFWK